MTNAVQRITTAVFPVAGLGTRFLPATKANPKEMLPVVDKPLIQYAAEEAVRAGIKTLVFVNGRSKRSIPDHFDKAYELEHELEARGKQALLDKVRNIVPPDVCCLYVRQADALGLGHAVSLAEPVVQNQPFAVILADDLIESRNGGALKEMIEVYEARHCSVLGVEEVPREHTSSYGVIAPEPIDERTWRVRDIVEKPPVDRAPSNIAVVGRYILTPKIFQLLREQRPGAGGEIQLTDAIQRLLQYEAVYAFKFSGRRFDCGSKLGYLQATVEFALQHPELAEPFRAYLASHPACRSA